MGVVVLHKVVTGTRNRVKELSGAPVRPKEKVSASRGRVRASARQPGSRPAPATMMRALDRNGEAGGTRNVIPEDGAYARDDPSWGWWITVDRDSVVATICYHHCHQGVPIRSNPRRPRKT
jgi:hypothetical protein